MLGMVPIARGLTVFPVLWCGVRLGASFIQYTGIAKISENLLDVGMLCLYLCFWLFHGRLWSGISSRKTARWVYGVGLAAALFGVICTVPRWIVSLTGISLHGASVPGAVDFMMAVYIVVFCFAAVRNIKSMRISGEPPAAQTLPAIEPLEDFTGGNGSPQQ